MYHTGRAHQGTTHRSLPPLITEGIHGVFYRQRQYTADGELLGSKRPGLLNLCKSLALHYSCSRVRYGSPITCTQKLGMLDFKPVEYVLHLPLSIYKTMKSRTPLTTARVLDTASYSPPSSPGSETRINCGGTNSQKTYIQTESFRFGRYMALGDYLCRFQFYLLCPSDYLSPICGWVGLQKLAVFYISQCSHVDHCNHCKWCNVDCCCLFA